jgi:hypothetical protein
MAELIIYTIIAISFFVHLTVMHEAKGMGYDIKILIWHSIIWPYPLMIIVLYWVLVWFTNAKKDAK